VIGGQTNAGDLHRFDRHSIAESSPATSLHRHRFEHRISIHSSCLEAH
jgi:hypothetical protein